jgi:hypothetical protein
MDWVNWVVSSTFLEGHGKKIGSFSWSSVSPLGQTQSIILLKINEMKKERIFNEELL